MCYRVLFEIEELLQFDYCCFLQYKVRSRL